MSTVETTLAGSDPEALADARIVAERVCPGKPVPAEVARRVQQRAEKIRDAILATHGRQDFSVQIIREARGPIDEEEERQLTLAQRDLLRKGDPRLVDPDTGETYVLV